MINLFPLLAMLRPECKKLLCLIATIYTVKYPYGTSNKFLYTVFLKETSEILNLF